MLQTSTTGHIAYVLKQKFSQFSKRNYVDLILEWGPYTWPPLAKYDVFSASILFVFCITMHYPVVKTQNQMPYQG